MIKKLLKFLFLVSLAVLVYAGMKRDVLPGKSEMLGELFDTPVQTKTAEDEFTTTREGVEYTVTPLFDYAIAGLVVSLHDSKSWHDLSHKGWRDYFNIRDIAVIWGNNLSRADYRRVKFSNTDFTVEWSYKTDVGFKANAISNNHLLADNTEIEDIIQQARVGDQIAMRGYLVNYAHTNGEFFRRSSVKRDDRGNGSCEILYVTDFRILQEANIQWRKIYTYAKYLTILLFIMLLLIPLFELIALTKQYAKQFKDSREGENDI